MNPSILSKILILITKSTFNDVDLILKPSFVETDKFYVLIKEYYSILHNNKGDNLSLEIPLIIQSLYISDSKIKDFLNGLKVNF